MDNVNYNDYRMPELLEFARDVGLRGYSKLRKPQLLKLLKRWRREYRLAIAAGRKLEAASELATFAVCGAR